MYYEINLYNHSSDFSNFIAKGIFRLDGEINLKEEIKEAGIDLLNEFNWEEDTSYENAYEILKCLAFTFCEDAEALVVLDCEGCYKCINDEIIKKVKQNYFKEFQKNETQKNGTMKILFNKTYFVTLDGNYHSLNEMITAFPVINLISERRENI